MPKVGDYLVDDTGRTGVIHAVLPDGIFAHPIEVKHSMTHNSTNPITIITSTWWSKFGIGYEGKWFDSPIGSKLIKAYPKKEAA